MNNLSVPSSRVKNPESFLVGKSFFFLFLHSKKVFEFMALKDGTDRLSRNVGKKLPLLVA